VDAHDGRPRSAVFEQDAVSLNPILDRKVAVLGYGTQGRAQARNLRDSGVDVIVGSRPGSATGRAAAREGFEVVTIDRATAVADVVVLLVPDEVQGRIYRELIAPNLRAQDALGFAHGFAIAFAEIVPDAGRPCFLAAPKGQGDRLREAFVRGGGLPGLLAVTDTAPPWTWDLAAAYAKAIGCLKGGGFKTTFREECVTDQFGEQVVLCGGVVELLQAAFDTLVARGYGSENAYFECVHELKLIADLLHRHGVDGMRRRISRTAAYGGLTRGPRVIDARVRRAMGEILDEIEAGDFAREFLARHDDAGGGIEPLAAREAASPLAQSGHRLRRRLASLGLDEDPDAAREGDHES
jgi:ketol-acid reductoisomerase